MNPGTRPTIPKWLRWVIWLLFLLTWTIALIAPIPTVDSLNREVFQISLRILFAKSLHVVAYAILTILSGSLLVPHQYRLFLLSFLMIHAPITEQFQILVGGRSGRLTDVLLDHAGVVLGLLLSYPMWTTPNSGKGDTPEKY